jgi:hypothetical protein
MLSLGDYALGHNVEVGTTSFKRAHIKTEEAVQMKLKRLGVEVVVVGKKINQQLLARNFLLYGVEQNLETHDKPRAAIAH